MRGIYKHALGIKVAIIFLHVLGTPYMVCTLGFELVGHGRQAPLRLTSGLSLTCPCAVQTLDQVCLRKPSPYGPLRQLPGGLARTMIA